VAFGVEVVAAAVVENLADLADSTEVGAEQ